MASDFSRHGQATRIRPATVFGFVERLSWFERERPRLPKGIQLTMAELPRQVSDVQPRDRGASGPGCRTLLCRRHPDAQGGVRTTPGTQGRGFVED